MKTILAVSLIFTLSSARHLVAEHWPLEAVAGVVKSHGQVTSAPGVSGAALVVAGNSVIELRDSPDLNPGNGFTVSAWFNPYDLASGQQMIVGKNRYDQNERQWGITLEPDGRLKAHLRQDGWREITCGQSLTAGHWHQVTLTVEAGQATLFLNGQSVGKVALTKPLPSTQAPITLGGILERGKARQPFHGALDEVRFEPRVMPAAEIAESYRPVALTHAVPKPKRADFPLWDDTKPLAEAKDLPVLDGVQFHVIKKWDQAGDGYTFLHGVGLAWHKGKLYASIGHNKGDENTVSEEAQYRVSEDAGKTWSALQVIDDGAEPDLAVSHGVFASHAGRLWAFHGAYYRKMERIHTRAYSLDESTGQWVKHGVVLENGFWVMNPPVKMNDGNWIMPGISAGPYSNDGIFPAAVAISRGDDFKQWDFISIPVHEGLRLWGESSLIVAGANVWNISRYGAKPLALISKSADYGRTWSTMAESNLPMTTSKPAAGMLSTGQRYLVSTTAANNGGRRSPLTLAVSEPGMPLLSRVYVIRHAEHDDVGESNAKASLSYPCATEYEGKLYVGYSNNGGRKGNLNSAELAVIPLELLR